MEETKEPGKRENPLGQGDPRQLPKAQGDQNAQRGHTEASPQTCAEQQERGEKGLVTASAPASAAEPRGLFPTASNPPEKASLGKTGDTDCSSGGPGIRGCQASIAAIPSRTSSALTRVLEWNTRSLNGSKLLAVMAKINDLKPDAVVLTETELEIGDKPNVPGYTTLLPRVLESSVVRTVMLIKKSLHPQQLESPADIPVVVVRIGKTVLLGVYRQFALLSPAGHSQTWGRGQGEKFESQQLDALEELVRTVSDRFSTVYITGDLNLDPTRLGEATYYKNNLLSRWLSLLEELGITWCPTGHTYTSDGKFDGIHRKSVLDHFYFRAVDNVNVRVLQDGLSDHSPILAQIGKASARKPDRQTRCDRNWKALNGPLLELSLLERDWSDMLATTNPDEAVALLDEALAAAVEVAVPKKTYFTPNFNVRLKADTRKCMRARDQAKAQGKECYKRLRNKCLSMVRRDHIQHNIERVRKGGQKSAWSIVNEVTGKGKGFELPLPDGCKSAEEAAQCANDYYVQKVMTLRKNLKANTTLKEAVSSDTGFRFHCVGTKTLKQALHNLQNKPSVGMDKIPIGVFKSGWSALALPLVHLVNTVIKTGKWPKRWKEILIKPVPKPKKPPLDIASYRPVALLVAVSKLTERVLYDQLIDFVESQGILPKEQHGFRKNHSTDSALASMMAKVAKALDKGLKVGLSCFDFSSAFDTVEPTVLDSKLGWASQLARALIKDYLSDGQQTVVWNGSTSKRNLIKYGVRQGSILGPLLYIILTSDLPKTMTSNVDKEAQAAASCYADDSTGIAMSRSWDCTDKAMSKIAANLAEYSVCNGLYLNQAKTQTMRLNHKDTLSTSTLDILGVHVTKSGGFSHAAMLADLRGRLGAVRRLATVMGRGKLLTEIAQSLVLGKVQCNAFITREARLDPKTPHGDDIATQRVLNDMYRTLIGAKRSDHIRVSDLADRAGLPTLNQIVVKQSAISAWRSQNGGPLDDILELYDDRTRGAANNWRRPASTRCVSSCNMASSWNASQDLREAKTLAEAKRAAKKLAQSVRHQ